MKRGREEEEDLSASLQFSDAEAAGPSNDGDNHWERELEPKHQIFLSHSGVQKNFTEQLCVDLEKWEYSPFFDKRLDSLPKGQNFPELIFQAAQQCHVAILVLSEDFFTRTKWPMLELEAFVQAQKDKPRKLAILPVYLGFSRHECLRNETRRAHWLSVWRDWAKDDNKIDVGKWEDALKVLNPLNGIQYEERSGEVELRKQIVSAVRCLLPPENLWSSANVQGKTHILKAIINKIKNIKPSPRYGVRVVGIYGMGGIGKTTFCKVLCDELHMKFKGRVCHVELGGKSEANELHKEVLQRLTDVNHDSLMFKDKDMTTNLLKRRLRQYQVFLAVDNVWQESLEQAEVYLRAGFHCGSIVMVTTRSIDILHCLNIMESDCLEMPNLKAEDAKQIFLHSATPCPQFISEGDEQKIQYCIRQCRFRKGVSMKKHYHPLALKVLGAQLGSLGSDPSVWVENLYRDDKFNHFRNKEHRIFNILRKGYDSLREEDQLLFMDAILFHPFESESIFPSSCYRSAITTKCNIAGYNIYEWLGIVHNLPEMRLVKDRLQVLKAKSLIEDIGDAFNGVIVHDLYLEFAKLEVKRGTLDARRWVWYDKEATNPDDLVKRPSGHCWPNVERISVKYVQFVDYEFNTSIQRMEIMDGVKWKHFSNVVVLQLLVGRNVKLDLRGLQCLKSLQLRWDVDGKWGFQSGGQLSGLGELRNLAWLDLDNIHFAPCFQEIGQLIRLEVLRLNSNCFFEPRLHSLELPNLGKCIHLRELVLHCSCLVSFPDLSKLTSLRKILLWGCKKAKELVGLSSQMTSLAELYLWNCSSLSQCHGLDDVVSLQRLCIYECSTLKQIFDLHKLLKLQQLDLTSNKFNKVLGLNDSMPLQELSIGGDSIDELPNLHLLRHLQRLKLSNIKPTMLPCFDSLTILEELYFSNLPEVKYIHGMHSLTRLKRLTLYNVPNLLQLPELGDLMALEYLSLCKCCHLVENLEVPDYHKLTNLVALEISRTPIRRLPRLGWLSQLNELDCSYSLLSELPVLNGLEKLESIVLSQCNELTSLKTVGSLPALVDLNVSFCSRLTRLPDLRNCKSLEYLNICGSGVRLSVEDIRTLATLPKFQTFGWEYDGVDFSKFLEEMSFEEVALHLEVKRLEFSDVKSESWILTTNLLD